MTVLTARAASTSPGGRPLEVSWHALHEKLGHASERKLRTLERAWLVKLTGNCEIGKCEPCLLCKPRRTSIPGVATHSGEGVVQVDGMPWKGGYRGQSGAIVFSHRVNKTVHVYPYCHKSEAVRILDDYVTSLSFTLISIECIYPFSSRVWTNSS